MGEGGFTAYGEKGQGVRATGNSQATPFLFLSFLVVKQG